MLIATWNIAGIKARLGTLLHWIEDCNPDVICLQEIKSATEKFPFKEFEALGYHIALNTQPQFNGVAILSKERPSQIVWGLNIIESEAQARLIKITINNKCGPIHLYCLYAPNGNPIHSEKYNYKLTWLSAFYELLKTQALADEIMILAGDFNIISNKTDAKNIEQWKEDALYSLQARRSLSKIKQLGFFDANELCNLGPNYSFWDFQKGAWQKNNGIRIDFLLLSPKAADFLVSSYTQKHLRDWEKPSDHVPVTAKLNLTMTTKSA